MDTSNQPDPDVRHDVGGWISGPCGPPPAAHGPFEHESDARDTPAVRAAYDAAHTRRGAMTEHNRQLLTGACAAAGVELGAYDDRILGWLAQWEPQMVMVVAGIILRASGTAP